MADAFSLRWKLDRPSVAQAKSEEVYALLTIAPNLILQAEAPVAGLPAHLLLLVDVSGSMDVLVRHDPNAQTVGEGLTEGRATHQVLSSVPSRREMACAVVQKLVERLPAEDLLTLVAFDDQAYLLGERLSPNNLEAVGTAIRQLHAVGGGGTHLGHGLEIIRKILDKAADPRHTRKLVLLTDGEDAEPNAALLAARQLAREWNLPIVAFGTGECKVAFLTQLAKTTLAGGFNHIRTETDAEQLFFQVWTNQKNLQATNVALKLWLSPAIQVRELYRTRPEILFVGDLQPDAQNQVELRLEQMERGKAYEFLFRCTVPARAANQRLRIAKATLTYDLPSEGLTQQTVETNIVVEYTADPNKARERSGDVRRVLARAEVQRQVLFLQDRIDALNRGSGGERDRTLVANLVQALIHKFVEFGDQAMANQYRRMQEELQRKGTISQDLLNRSLAASSRAEEVIIAQDIDF